MQPTNKTGPGQGGKSQQWYHAHLQTSRAKPRTKVATVVAVVPDRDRRHPRPKLLRRAVLCQRLIACGLARSALLLLLLVFFSGFSMSLWCGVIPRATDAFTLATWRPPQVPTPLPTSKCRTELLRVPRSETLPWVPLTLIANVKPARERARVWRRSLFTTQHIIILGPRSHGQTEQSQPDIVPG